VSVSVSHIHSCLTDRVECREVPTKVGSSLAHNHWTWAMVTYSDEHSSLVRGHGINYDRKIFL